MIKSKTIVTELRRDAFVMWHAAIAVVFIGFAGIAVAAALVDVFWAVKP